MKFSLNASSPLEVQTPCLVVGIFEDAPLSGAVKAVDEASGGLISRLVESGDIDPDRCTTTLLHGVDGVAADRVLVVGFGEPDRFTRARYQAACLAAGAFLREHTVTEAHVCLHDLPVEDLDRAWRLRQAVLCLERSSYRYTATKARKPETPNATEAFSFDGDASLQAALDTGVGMSVGVATSRELGNLPPNICNPAYLAQQSIAIAEKYPNCSIEVLERSDMAELGMDALLGVAQGSTNEPKLIVLTYKGAGDAAPHVLVGKGVTFDSGGISLKPREGMDQMKFDMGGAAAVIGAFEACAALQLDVNAMAIVAAVENMPDGNAYRPGDVLTSMSGKTIEILNTDAEGRLALCDALTYCERFEPASVIDVATLTGACVVALGHHASAVMSKDDGMADDIIAAGQETVDRAWRLPLWEDYNAQLKSPFADMKNVGGMPAGAITAGCFLAKFTKNLRWAHVDVAGSAWKWGENEGSTGRPAAMLTQYLIDRAAEG